MSDWKLSVREHVIDYLNDNNLSQREFAQKINVEEWNLCRYLRLERKPSLDFCIKVCEELEISLDELCGRK